MVKTLKEERLAIGSLVEMSSSWAELNWEGCDLSRANVGHLNFRAETELTLYYSLVNLVLLLWAAQVSKWEAVYGEGEHNGWALLSCDGAQGLQVTKLQRWLWLL